MDTFNINFYINHKQKQWFKNDIILNTSKTIFLPLFLTPIWKDLHFFGMTCINKSRKANKENKWKRIFKHPFRFHLQSKSILFCCFAICCTYTQAQQTKKLEMCLERFTIHCIGQHTLASIFLHSFMDLQIHLYHRLTAASLRITIPIMIQAPSQISSLQPKASPFAKTKQCDLSFFPSSPPQRLCLHFIKHLPAQSHL